MSTKRNYYLVGRTNPYQAQCGRHCAFFRRRIMEVGGPKYMTQEEAAAWIMNEAENDHGVSRDENTGILLAGSIDEVMPGGTMYHHDGYTWSLKTVDEMDEHEAARALLVSSPMEQEAIYERFPELRPDESEA